MAKAIIMPKQGQSVESCIITRWLKKEGDKVEVGDILFEYETDKASFEEESQQEGVLLKILFQDGDEVEVLKTVAIIGKEGEDFSSLIEQGSDVSEVAEEKKPEIVEKKKPVSIDTKTTIQHDGTVIISPRAKNLAEKNRINYFNLQGTGPNGRIIERDILSAIANKKKATPLAKSISEKDNIPLPSSGSGYNGKVLANDVLSSQSSEPGEAEIQKLSNLRKIIARRMYESLQNSAQLTLHASADARNIKALRKELKAKGENITINDIICHAVIKSLQQYPRMNAHFNDDHIKIFKQVNLGIAVDTPRGLLVPTIHNANFLSLSGLANSIKTIAGQCQQGNVNPDLLEGGTFTVTNLGTFGIEQFTPVLNTPQIGILGVGNISLKPVENKDESYGFAPHLSLSLTFDHRAIDGADAARFLVELKKQLNTIKFS